MKGNKYVARMLAEYNVSHLFYQDFAMPNTLTELKREGVKLILCKSEFGAAYMADGYARASCKPGVVITQAIGSANLAAGLHDAYLAGSPVIAVTDKKTCKYQYRNAYQCSDHKRLFDATCRFNAFCDDPAEWPRILNQAFREVTCLNPGPAYIDSNGFMINTPLDLADLPDEIHINKRFASYPPFRPCAEERDVRSAAEAIMNAKKPVMVVGRGAVISGASEEVRGLAYLADMPVLLTPDGKGILDETDAVFGGIIGAYGMKGANQTVQAADLVFYVGCGTNDHTTLDFTSPDPLTPVIQLDIDPVELGRGFVNCIPLCADAREGLKQLIKAMERQEHREWREQAANNMETTLRAMKAHSESTAQLTPADICGSITRVLPENGIIVSDTGYSAIWSANYIHVKPSQFYTRAAGSLGWSYPASLGCKCAAPDRPVVCFLGDGAFYYYLNEMETAVRNDINTVTIINNNGGYNQCGIIHENLIGKEEAADRYQFTPVNFEKVCQGFHVWYRKVEKADELDEAISSALAAGKPAVVECVTTRDFHPLACK